MAETQRTVQELAPAIERLAVWLARLPVDSALRGYFTNGMFAHDCNDGAVLLRELLAALASQAVPVAEWVRSPVGDFPQLVWERGYEARIGDKLYTAPPAPAQAEPLPSCGQVERLTACIEQMTSDLARCRDAFGIPAGDGHLSDAWTSAMAMPEEVPHYVEAAAAHLGRVRRAAQRALDAWDSTVLPKAHDGMMQERMEELRGECIEQARIDKQRADTAEARLERAEALLDALLDGEPTEDDKGRARAFLGEGHG